MCVAAMKVTTLRRGISVCNQPDGHCPLARSPAFTYIAPGVMVTAAGGGCKQGVGEREREEEMWRGIQ